MIERLHEAQNRRKQRLESLKDPDLQSLKQRHPKKRTILHSNDLHGDFLAETSSPG